MAGPRRAWGTFLAVQAFAFLIAAFVLDRSSFLRAILPGQAALVGILAAIGPIRHAARIVAAIIVGALFAVVVSTLALRLNMAGLFGMHGYGWQFLMMTVRALLIAAFFFRMFLRNGYQLSTSGEAITETLLRFRLQHLLALMSLVALFIVIIRNMSGGRFYGISLVAYVTLLGVAYALMDLLAALLSLERRYTLPKAIAYVLAIQAFSLAVAAHAYASASGWSSAKFTWMETMVEVGWICGSLVALRFCGFQLVKVAADSTLAAASKFARLKHAPSEPYGSA